MPSILTCLRCRNPRQQQLTTGCRCMPQNAVKVMDMELSSMCQGRAVCSGCIMCDTTYSLGTSAERSAE